MDAFAEYGSDALVVVACLSCAAALVAVILALVGAVHRKTRRITEKARGDRSSLR